MRVRVTLRVKVRVSPSGACSGSPNSQRPAHGLDRVEPPSNISAHRRHISGQDPRPSVAGLRPRVAGPRSSVAGPRPSDTGFRPSVAGPELVLLVQDLVLLGPDLILLQD